jgi:hypothetical protein
MRDAGAIASFDSRFLYNLSNNDPISTWPDRTRSANNATSSSTERPVYKVNAINGQPAAEWGSDANYRFMAITSITNPASSTVLTVQTRTASSNTLANFGKPSTDLYPFIWFNNNIIYERYNTGTFREIQASQTQTGSFVLCSVKNGTTASQHYRNGAAVGSQGTPPASNSDFTRIGFYNLAVNLPSHRNTGNAGNFTILDASASSALRRRMEHSLAYSFKISCN